MKIFTQLPVAIILSLFVGTHIYGQVVARPDARLAIITSIESLLDAKPQGIPVGAKDPFNSDDFQEAMGFAKRVPSDSNRPTVGPRSDRDLLEAIAANLRPSGNFILGGQHTLIFGQKRVKAGNTLTINFEGNEYTIEITAIDRANFSLKLNQVELTRPIK